MHNFGFLYKICYLLQYYFQYLNNRIFRARENKHYNKIPINLSKKSKGYHLKCLLSDFRVTSIIIMKGAKPSSKWTIHTLKIISQFGK